ncbi:MAG: CbiX/SirB N-terminal domain-containing protein [Candidatus Sumerlaeaceae bacterium]|nr:CbiX/SirB N-terminal domain-containing protein [Candidatus Sumerlaeaceae bacterium]
MTRALLIMVHGSPRPEANADVYRVAEAVKGSRTFDHVEVGFLECNQPDILKAVENCLATGATQITAVAYFLHTGSHVCEDLPGLLEEARKRHPEVEFLMGSYVGRSPHVTALLARRGTEALTRSRGIS